MSQYKVATVIDDNYKVVINAGRNKKISLGDRFLVYTLSTYEILDPDTNESLGFFGNR